MRLSSMADYAVVIMSAAARHCGTCSLIEQAGGKRGRVSAAQLAEETGLPAPTVQKLVSKLSAAGLMRSSRGAGGGLRLARPPATISLADIVEAVEGPIALTACIDRVKSDCTLEGACTTRSHWPQVNAAVRGALAQVALTQFVEEV
ncbi:MULTISPECIES: RrF2 family transcriptional regulator [Novosphingobium]|jgi:FeS assembly SUF system regulator|uniref:Transcriptional regulator, BadM/Rrf2 family n=1 Tax=Novosphingobium panipatense TaxID=428991 RepID=A0ABY1QDC9_9SPHN|nr:MULTISPECIES: Rrf2 family transcriptional regulator [Novosphingobium]SMP67248.1 transcriptional regulator, BadM/Rrf2 family [Novosphingobium panipatense]